MNEKTSFSKKLIKGKIAEIIFQQLLRDAGCFTVLSFGYENIVPEIANRHDDIKARETMEVIRRSPDFAVINNENHEVSLIEVKYRMHPKKYLILRDALRMYQSWKPSYLFIATPQGFYFDKVENIVQNNGEIKKLTHPKVSEELQNQYIALLNEFIKPKFTKQ